MVNENSDTSTSAHAQKEGGGFRVSEDFEQKMVQKYEQVPEEIVHNEITTGLEHLPKLDNPPRTSRAVEFYIQHRWLPKAYAFAEYGVAIPNLPPARDRDQEVPRTTPRSRRKPATRARDEAAPELSQYMLDKLEGSSGRHGQELRAVAQNALNGGLPNKFKDLHQYLQWWEPNFQGGFVNSQFPGFVNSQFPPEYLTRFYPERSSSSSP